MQNELLRRMERVVPECGAAVGELVWPVMEATRCQEWERARRCALEFLASTPQDALHERLFEYQLQQLFASASNSEVAIEVHMLTKLRVFIQCWLGRGSDRALWTRRRPVSPLPSDRPAGRDPGAPSTGTLIDG